jgi:hypothetical protein
MSIKNEMYLTDQNSLLTESQVIAKFDVFREYHLSISTKENQFALRFFSFEKELGLMMHRRDGARELEDNLHARLEYDIDQNLHAVVV